MKNILIKELLEMSEDYEREYPEAEAQNLVNFSAWLTNQVAANVSLADVSLGEHTGLLSPEVERYPMVSFSVGRYLSRCYRYFRNYTKKAFEDSLLLTYDDFICLAILAEVESITKMELVEATVNEKTSGMLVIKRLLDKNLAAQYDDEHDKRSKRLKITEAGRTLFREALIKMEQAIQLLQGDLTGQEQLHLLHLFTRLDKFHYPLFVKEKDTDLETLLQRGSRDSELGYKYQKNMKA